ncbi:DUF943 family protein [Salmonella enterica subsp. enterica serovar Carswell]|nr:DUF943 family protein [Salmonella enterica]
MKRSVYVIMIITFIILSVFMSCWLSRPVEIIGVHYYSDEKINIVARHFPFTDQGKLDWWRKNEKFIIAKYNLPESHFSVNVWNFGEGYQKLSPYVQEDEFYCFSDIKSESKCIKKDLYMSAESGGNYHRIFLLSDSGYFYQRRKDDQRLIKMN